jgi:thioredoxin domain-containing protein 10
VVLNLHHVFYVRILFKCNCILYPQSIFKSSPLMGCFLFGLPLGVISIMCYGIYTADTDGGYIEERYEVSKSEMENQEQIEESKEQESSSGGSLAPTVQEPKDVLEKKKD